MFVDDISLILCLWSNVLFQRPGAPARTNTSGVQLFFTSLCGPEPRQIRLFGDIEDVLYGGRYPDPIERGFGDRFDTHF